MGSAALWRSRARLEENAGQLGRARALLEQARLKNAGNDELWLAAIRTEQRASNSKAAEALMAKALQVRLLLSRGWFTSLCPPRASWARMPSVPADRARLIAPLLHALPMRHSILLPCRCSCQIRSILHLITTAPLHICSCPAAHFSLRHPNCSTSWHIATDLTVRFCRSARPVGGYGQRPL